jgi:hypothetical protein
MHVVSNFRCSSALSLVPWAVLFASDQASDSTCQMIDDVNVDDIRSLLLWYSIDAIFTTLLDRLFKMTSVQTSTVIDLVRIGQNEDDRRIVYMFT